MATLHEGPLRLVIVGAGVAGLAAARAALDRMPDLDVRVLERSDRVGGLVETEHTDDGFTIEYGADCLVTAKPAGMETVRRMGLQGSLLPSVESARTTFVARSSELVPMPAGLAFGALSRARDVFGSRALSVTAKLRLALEPFLSARSDDVDESVAAFVTRRFGREFLEQVIGPVLEGVHGVPAAELSARACLPRLLELEQADGSVVRGMRKLKTTGVPSPPVLSLQTGMASLPHAMAQSLLDRIHTGIEVYRIERGVHRLHRLRFADGGSLEADAIIVAAPAYAAAALVEPLSPALASLLARVRYSRLDCLTLAWPLKRVPHPLQGSGFVVPSQEHRPTRACTWSSVKWPGRAPEGRVLMRCVLAGEHATEFELLESARRDLAELMGITSMPVLVRSRRVARALPIQDLGCGERLARMHEHAAEIGQFALAGNAHGGVGVPDCIDSGRRAAERVTRELLGRAASRSEPNVWQHAQDVV